MTSISDKLSFLSTCTFCGGNMRVVEDEAEMGGPCFRMVCECGKGITNEQMDVLCNLAGEINAGEADADNPEADKSAPSA
jgi:hypothetical protein